MIWFEFMERASVRCVRKAAFVLVLLAPPYAASESTPFVPSPEIVVNDGDAVFFPISERRQDMMQPKIGNGSVADTNQWPATVVTLAGGMGQCTATFIGPEVLLTAAHCVGQGAKATIPNWNTTGVCRRHSGWVFGVNMSPDWALCRMTKVERPGLFFERLNMSDDAVKVGTTLALAGFGCIDLEANKPEDPPVLRVGNTVVDRLPNPNASWGNWIVSVPATQGGGSFVCPGDSGGAVYRVSISGARFIVGVVSSVGADKDKADYKASYVSALATPDLRTFFKQWSENESKPPLSPPEICGVTIGDSRCRPTPP